ncbi:hypothetical protein PSHT_02061 [Puccinia striiformis]|uniref:Uncharacterized protein n=1 Tax=Puccinia striiformis TaxID=27350 RepID=A0A2S4WJ56_9BASI|nr:hypothetical protein PSHT_02061 [Puccinia striiformis]
MTNVTFFGKNARPCLRSAASSSSRIAQSSAKFMDTSIRESPLEARFEYKVKISPVQDDRPPDHSALNPSDPSLIRILSILSLLVGLCFETVNANWDEATGYLHDYKPSDGWLSKNKHGEFKKNRRVGTRPSGCLPSVNILHCVVQLMALFTVNHADDRYHGCPYGTCCAFTQLPLVNDMEPNPGNRTYGYETSIDGTFHRGPVDKRTRQPNHDRNYPGFHLPKAWPKRLPFPKQPNIQPACAAKGQANMDPGQEGERREGGRYGGRHKGHKNRGGSSGGYAPS